MILARKHSFSEPTMWCQFPGAHYGNMSVNLVLLGRYEKEIKGFVLLISVVLKTR